MKWLEIAVRVRPGDVDAAGGLFDLIGTGGVVIEDPALIYEVIAGGNRETVAMDLPGSIGELPVVKGYLPVDERLAGRLEEFRAALGGIDPEYPPLVSLEELEDGSWLARWRELYRPVKIGRKFVVRPAWGKDDVEEGLLEIRLDPGLAFGCGTHPTTAMCMVLLEEVIRGGERVLDVGTGSGILAIAAARLGAAMVLAVDSDPLAVRVAWENVAANGVEDIVSVREGDLLDGVEVAADVVVVNIVADAIIKVAPQAMDRLGRGGLLIVSGVISHRRDEVAAALRKCGLTMVKTLEEGEWAGFLCCRPAAV